MKVGELNELSKLIIGLRGSESIRKVAKRAGISHNYLGILEKGFDPQTKAPINPSPETLMNLANAYDYPYEELMRKAGYLASESKDLSLEETKKSHTLETIDRAIFDEFMKLDPKKKDKLRRIMEIVKEE